MPKKRVLALSPSRVDGDGRLYLPKQVREALLLGDDGGFVSFDIQDLAVVIHRVQWLRDGPPKDA